MTRILVSFLILASFFVFPAKAQEKPDFSELRLMETVIVSQVIDPLRIQVKDGRIIQLASLDIPDLDPYEPGELSVAARDMLKERLTGKQVRFYQTKDAKKGRMNRMSYHLGHLVTSQDNIWIQGALLENGFARIRPSQRNIEMAQPMMTLEDAAQKEKKGLWKQEERYKPLTADTADQGMNGWAIVEGTVKKVAMVNNVIYLNFGDNWRTDFTIAIDSKTRRDFVKQNIDVMGLGNQTIRARGWIRDYNGPYMELIHPVWMEIMEQKDSL